MTDTETFQSTPEGLEEAAKARSTQEGAIETPQLHSQEIESEPAQEMTLPEDEEDAMSVRKAGEALSKLREERDQARRLFDEASGESQHPIVAPAITCAGC
jgi:hypothetical protein